jgi:hypothetical protein
MTTKTLGIISGIEFLIIIVLCFILNGNKNSINKNDADILKSQGIKQEIELQLSKEKARNDSLQKLLPKIDTTIAKEEKNLTQIIYVYKKDSARITSLDADESISLLSTYLSQKDSAGR